MSQHRKKGKRHSRPKARPIFLDAESAALMRLVERRQVADAELAARRILARQPSHHLALKALSFALLGQNRFEEALPVLEFALARFEADPELHNNLGIVLSYLMRWDEALARFRRSLELHPDESEVLKNLGAALSRMQRWDDAVPVLLQAIEHHRDDYIEAIRSLGLALLSLHRYDEAWVCFNELWQADASDTYALYQLLSVSLHNCAWQDLAARLAALRQRDPRGVASAGPFRALAFPGFTGSEHLAFARVFSESCFPAALLAAGQPVSAARAAGRRLRIGFMSADFGEHAVAYVLPQVIELLDRGRLELFGYSIGKDDKSPLRARLAAAFEHFTDLAPLSHRASVERIRAHEVDILVDLQGWTARHRGEILALRGAPIQVNWLGYPGTLGHPRLADYLLGDATVTPLEHAACYTETLVQLPHCYLPADATRLVPPAPTRAEAGLPERGFVFCSLNASYKFNPETFDVWCRVLLRCPDSILWLSSPSPTARSNLEREAANRGVDPARLVFAPRTETQAQHLARLQLADLALDTFPYNSHSTGIDTLWAGVPMVTCMGETFASRVGASTLSAAKLDELVTTSLEQYEGLILDLYRDRNLLAQLRQRLNTDKTSLPLFDMPAFARALEDVLLRMWEDHLQGRKEPIAAASAGLAH